MDMATFRRESALNRDAYHQLRDQIQRDYAGKYVVLARGRILGAAKAFDEARRLLDLAEERPEYYLIFLAEDEPHFGLVYDLSGNG